MKGLDEADLLPVAGGVGAHLLGQVSLQASASCWTWAQSTPPRRRAKLAQRLLTGQVGVQGQVTGHVPDPAADREDPAVHPGRALSRCRT